MNDMNAILAKIEEDAKAVAAKTLEHAQERRNEIIADYDEKIKQQCAQILKETENQILGIQLRSVSQSGIEERNQNLQTRRFAMDAAFEKAMELICGISAEKKVAFYSQMIVESMNGDAELILNASEKAEIGEAVVAMVHKKFATAGNTSNLTLSSIVGPFRGGLKLKQGNIETNCTFEVLMSRAKDELEPDVARALFA